jgi:hypothetical protein
MTAAKETKKQKAATALRAVPGITMGDVKELGAGSLTETDVWRYFTCQLKNDQKQSIIEAILVKLIPERIKRLEQIQMQLKLKSGL